MDQESLKILLDKEAAGTLTEAEHEQLNRWYDTLELKKDAPAFKDQVHEDLVKQQLLHRILAHVPVQREPRQVFMLTYRQWLRVAAVFVLGVLGFQLYRYAAWRRAEELAEAQAPRTFRAAVGRQMLVTLTDGTMVTLNAGSALQAPDKFGGDTREVTLQGEAFFEVAHNALKPFIVHTGPLETKVLGTSFTVRAYPELDQFRINLITGRVAVSEHGKELCHLMPSQQVIYEPLTGTYRLDSLDAMQAKAWLRGEIWLNGDSFEALALMFKNTWGYTLQTTSPRLKDVSYKITFNTNDKIENVMNVITRITASHYRIQDHTITLYEKE